MYIYSGYLLENLYKGVADAANRVTKGGSYTRRRVDGTPHYQLIILKDCRI